MKHPSSRSSSRTVLAVAGVVLLGLTAACGDDDDSADTTAAAITAAPSASEAPAATAAPSATTEAPAATDAPAGSEAPAGSAAPAGESQVNVADSSLGQILVDGGGMTLYMFVPDNQGPSTCTGGCADAWPGLPGPATAGDGVTGTLGTATRPDDSSEQVTINGWPLYRFAQDTAPGDVNGQDSGDKWYVLDASGTPVGMNG